MDAVRDYGFDSPHAGAEELPSSPDPSTRGPVSANHGKQSVEIGPFTKIPNKLFGSGTARDLKPSATLLYVALCEHANRAPSNTFKASDKALASETTLSPRTICNERKRLIENGLITVTREPGQSYFYTLTVPSLEWVPLSERPRATLKPRAYHAQR